MRARTRGLGSLDIFNVSGTLTLLYLGHKSYRSEQFRSFTFPPKLKLQLAQRLVTAAGNSKNPKAADLAFEVSKIYVVGFGFSKDAKSVESWLHIAADRGHELAKALVAQLGIPEKETTHLRDAACIETPEPDTVVLRMNRNLVRASVDKIKMDHIANFETYVGHDMETVRSLIEESISQGLNIDLINGMPDPSKQQDWSRAKMPLLHLAAATGRLKLIQILLEFGVDVDSIDPRTRRTPLITSLDSGEIEVAELLLEQGANVHMRDPLGRCALHLLHNVPPQKFASMLHRFREASKATRSQYDKAFHKGDRQEDPFAVQIPR